MAIVFTLFAATLIEPLAHPVRHRRDQAERMHA